MLLLVDAGNTRIKWALVPHHGAHPLGRWTLFGAVARQHAIALADTWRDLPVTHVLLSNVAGEGMRTDLETALLQALGSRLVPVEWFRSAPECAGLRNAYRNPLQLGCDRFASAIGAHALFPGRPLIVATCGTATTIDAITADGTFTGGMILPGLGVMAASLARHTAQLPQVAHTSGSTSTFADNTDAAIVSGCLAAQAGAIERAVAAMTSSHGAPQCIISGGAASMIAPHLNVPCTPVENLVLIGLQAVASQFCQS